MLKVVKLHEDATIPTKAHDGDAGFDIYALEDVVLNVNQTKLVSTGIGIEVPLGYFGDITGKSGLTSKSQLRVERGIVDHGYQGEVKVILSNYRSTEYTNIVFGGLLLSSDSATSIYELCDQTTDAIIDADNYGQITIKKGQKIAQLILTPCDASSRVEVMESFTNTSTRGDGGFGSTGIYQSGDGKYESQDSASVEPIGASTMSVGKINNSGVYGIPVPDGLTIADGDHIPLCIPDDGRAQIESFINLRANGFIGG